MLCIADPHGGGCRREKGIVPMLKYMLVLLCLAAPAAAERKIEEHPPAWLKSVTCRIVSREGGSSASLLSLNDVIIDTLSKNSLDHTVKAVITGGRMLGASVQYVNVNAKMPRERFNVAMALDGKTYLRMNHLDLDIFLETTIAGHIYILHCFQETK